MAATPNFVIQTSLNLQGFEAGITALQARIAKLQKDFQSQAAYSPVPPNQYNTALAELDKMNQQIRGTTRPIKDMNAGLRQTGTNLGEIGRRVFIWGVLSAGIFGVIQNLREAVQFTLELNTAMAELRKVMPRNTDFNFLQNQTFELGFEFGREPLEVAQVLKRFGQAGLEAKDAIAAARTTLLGLNTTGARTEEVINAVIAANKIFNVAFEDSATIMDKIQRIQAEVAVDAKDLVASITAIGPAIEVLNGDINDLFAITAALGEAARISGKEASNAFKRVLARIVTKEGIDALQNLNVAVFDTADNFRPLIDIFADLGKALETATQVEKQHIAVTLAQVRQYPKFAAFLAQINRALEIQEKSLNASGAAFNANQVIMDTYQKRMAQADVGIQKMQESLIGGSGLVENLTSAKVLLGQFADLISLLPSGFTNVALTVGVLAVSFKTARLFMLGFGSATKDALKDLTVFEVFMGKRFGKTLDKTQTAALGTVGAFARFSAVVPVAAAALFLLAPAIEAAISKFSEGDAAVEAARKTFENFAKTLDTNDFGDLSAISGTVKLSLFQAQLEAIIDKMKEGKVPITSFIDAISTLTSGKLFKNLDDKEVASLLSLLDRFKEQYIKALQAITNEDLGEPLENFKTILGEVTQGLAKVDIETPKGIDLFIDKLIELRSKLGFVGGKFIDIQELRKLNSAIDLQKNLIEGTRKELSKQGNSQAYINALNKQLAKAEADLNKTQSERVALINSTIPFYEDILNIKRKELELQAKINISASDSAAFGKERENDIDQAAKKLLDFVGANNLVNKVLKDAKIAANDIDFTGAASEAKIFNDILVKALEQVDSLLLEKLGETKYKQLADQIEELKKEIKSAAEVGKTFVDSFNITPLLNSVKRGISGVVTSFTAEVDVINRLNTAYQKSNTNYNLVENNLKAVSTAVTALTTRYKDNQSRLTALRQEEQALAKILSIANDPDENRKFSQDDLDATRAKLKDIQAEYITLSEVVDEDNKKFNETLGVLVEIEKQQKLVVVAQKLQQLSIGAQTKETEKLLQQQIKINNISTLDDTSALKKNETLYKQILATRIAEVKANQMLKNIDDDKARLEIATLQNKVSEEELSRALEVSYRRTEKALNRINSIHGDIQSSIKNTLSNTQEWINNLEQFGAGGALLGLAKNLFGGVADSIAQSEADLVGEVFGNRLAESLKFLDQQRSEVINTLSSPEVSNNLSGSIISASEIMAENTYNAIIKAWGDVSATEIPRISTSLGEGVSEVFLRKLISTLNQFEDSIKTITKGEEKQSTDINNSTNTPTKIRPVGIIDESIVLNKAQSEQTKQLSLVAKTSNAQLLESLTATESTNNKLQQVQTQISEVIAAIDRNTSLTSGAVDEVNSSTEALITQQKEAAKKALLNRAISFAGAGLGVALAKSQGRDASGVKVGSDVASIGALLLGANPTTAAIAGVGGALFGGLLGGKKKEDEVADNISRIARNTAKLVDRLSPEIINAPAGFSIPAAGGSSTSGVNITNTFNVTGSDSVEKIVRELETQMSRIYNTSSNNSSFLE